MANKFRGSARRIREAALKTLSEVLGNRFRDWRETQLTALSDFAVLSTMIPNLGRWTAEEKRQLVQIIQAKAGPDEAKYLKLMQKHARLQQEVIRLGS
jgi:hypothetical protein